MKETLYDRSEQLNGWFLFLFFVLMLIARVTLFLFVLPAIRSLKSFKVLSVFGKSSFRSQKHSLHWSKSSSNRPMDNYTGRQVSLSYSDPAEIVQLIRKDGVDENYTILDVRDEDEYYGGHIKGAKNHPSGYWSDYTYVREIVEENLEKDTIVVHCFYSKQRGPTCARILADNLERYLLEAPREKIPKM